MSVLDRFYCIPFRALNLWVSKNYFNRLIRYTSLKNLELLVRFTPWHHSCSSSVDPPPMIFHMIVPSFNLLFVPVWNIIFRFAATQHHNKSYAAQYIPRNQSIIVQFLHKIVKFHPLYPTQKVIQYTQISKFVQYIPKIPRFSPNPAASECMYTKWNNLLFRFATWFRQW